MTQPKSLSEIVMERVEFKSDKPVAIWDQQTWTKSNENVRVRVILEPLITSLAQALEKAEGALEKISGTSCYAHPQDLQQYRRETAISALKELKKLKEEL